jgi:hypothetical protein
MDGCRVAHFLITSESRIAEYLTFFILVIQ